jgi:hypothetical protein
MTRRLSRGRQARWQTNQSLPSRPRRARANGGAGAPERPSSSKRLLECALSDSSTPCGKSNEGANDRSEGGEAEHISWTAIADVLHGVNPQTQHTTCCSAEKRPQPDSTPVHGVSFLGPHIRFRCEGRAAEEHGLGRHSNLSGALSAYGPHRHQGEHGQKGQRTWAHRSIRHGAGRQRVLRRLRRTLMTRRLSRGRRARWQTMK